MANDQQPIANSQQPIANSQQPTADSQLSFWQRLLYGSGSWGLSSAGMLRSVFYPIYLTDVVGLDPGLASFAAIFGVLWDAVNDPLVGMLSDRMRSKRGRRLPFLLWFAIPFGLSFVLLWWAPPWDSQVALAIHIALAFAIADTLSTLISIPYYSLMPELVTDYDERTRVNSYRTFFDLSAALTVVIAHPILLNMVLLAAGTQDQGFVLIGALFGGLAIPSYLIMPFVFREKKLTEEPQSVSMPRMLKTAWANVPFRFVAGIHTFNWCAVDMVAVTFPYFVQYWLAKGDLLATMPVFGVDLAMKSVFLGALMFTCILVVPFWLWLSRRTNKRSAYMAGLVFWIVVQFLLFTVQPGQLNLMLIFSILAGIGLSSAYVLPDAIFPDVIEWDELKTGRRQEGIYYGARAFIRKMASALVVFVTLQLLNFAGYQNPPDTAIVFAQPDSVLTMIRLLVSPIGAVILSGALVMAYLYPLSRERYARIRAMLARRKARSID